MVFAPRAGIAQSGGMSIGTRIKEARKCAKLTQAELASRVGISQQGIARLERGGAEGTKALAMIAVECKVSARWLATGEGDMLDGAATAEAVTLTPRELALIANYRASPDSDRAKIERLALGIAQQAVSYNSRKSNSNG